MRIQKDKSAFVAQRRTCIIVAGMHRSGTSAATRVINLLGADITADLMPAVDGNNDRGFWESMAVYEIHERLLQALGGSWHDPSPLPERWVETSAARDAKRQLIGALAKDFPHSQLFVVKDPRIARLLPLWLEMLDELDIEPVVVISCRNPLEIAASLEKRDGLLVAKSLLLYVRSNLEAERASRGRRRLFVNYGDLLEDWPAFAQRLGKLVAPHKLVQRKETAAEIGNFLSVDLHHNRSSRERLAASPGLATTLIEIHDRMIEVVKPGDEAKLRASFDRLSATVDEATKLYNDLVVAERAHGRAEIARMQATVDRLQATLEALQAALEEKTKSYEDLVVAAKAREDEIQAKADAQRDRLQAELTQRTHERDKLRAELADTAAKLDLAQRSIQRLETKLAGGLGEVVRLQQSKSFKLSRFLPSLHRRVAVIFDRLTGD